MKKFLLIVIVFIYNSSSSQERINKELPKLSEPISTLMKATGWYYDDNGQWLNYKNNLANRDEFNKYEFRTISYNDKSYLMFLKYNYSGYFDYPSISEGYHSYEEVHYYIIEKDDYQIQVNNCDSNCVLKFKIRDMGSETVGMFKNIAGNVLNFFNDNKFKVKENKFLVFQFRNYKVKKISRFIFFVQDCSYNNCYNEGFTTSHIINEDFFKYLLSNELYLNTYYESNYYEFNNFIHLIKK